MERPAEYWHELVLNEDVVEQLDSLSENHEELLCRAARNSYAEYPRVTPEYMAKTIGQWMVREDKVEELESTVDEGTNGSEGKEMALGYFGVRAFDMDGREFPTG